MLRIAKKLVQTASFESPIPAIRVLPRFYDKKVVDHFNNPRNVGSFDKEADDVGSALVGAPACGDVMKFQIKVDDNRTIVDSCFKTFGCGSAIASSSVGRLFFHVLVCYRKLRIFFFLGLCLNFNSLFY